MQKLIQKVLSDKKARNAASLSALAVTTSTFTPWGV